MGAGVLEYCQAEGLAFLPWSPLGGSKNAGGAGLLRNAAEYPNLNRIAAAKGCGPVSIVLDCGITQCRIDRTDAPGRSY